jgi:hypothetical protein
MAGLPLQWRQAMNASVVGALVAGGWDAAVGRLVAAAPPLARLGEWLLWSVVFEPCLGPLRAFLRRAAPGLGVGVLELACGECVKLDAVAGTSEVFAAALAARDTARAAESSLAFCHGCGGARQAPLVATLGGVNN